MTRPRRRTRRLFPALFAVAALANPSADLPGQEPPGPPTIEELEAEIHRATQSGTPGELAAAHNSLGLFHWNHARYDSAVVHLDRARVLWTDVGDAAALGRAYNNLGAAHYQWGNYGPALDAFLRSLELRRATGDQRGEGLVLTNIGRTYHDWQQHERARTVLKEALDVAEASGDPFARGYALHNLGILELNLENFDDARELFLASLDAYQADDPRLTSDDATSGWALNILGLGTAHVRAGDPEEGIRLLQEALTAAEADAHPRRELRALVVLGEAHRTAGDLDRAVALLDRALALAREVGQRTLALEALAELATVHEARGAFAEALANLRAHDALRDSIFNQSAAQRVAAMEAEAEADRRERENVLLREEQQLQEATIARQRLVFMLGGGFLLVSLLLLAVLVHFNRVGRDRERLLAEINAALENSNRDLRDALSEVRTLEGLIPICVHCKNVRDDQGFWEGVETYISERSEALFSHSICAECGPRIYGDDWSPAPSREPDKARFGGSREG